ncbi:MAG TPA: TolC family protein [Steroidobacteraceae bacterium]|nr:TolC family protein [Steroidobacteraceae bacterium]
MRRTAIALVTALVTLAAAPRAPAQGNARIITFQDAIGIALEQNTTVRAAQNAASLSKVEVDAAQSQFLPDLRLSTTGSRNYGRSFDQTEGQIVDRTTKSASLGLNTGVTLFDGFSNTATLKGARLSDEAAEHELHRTRETVAFTVASNFLTLIQRQEQLRVQRENLQAATALERQIQQYVDAGARTIADLYQQQANVASARFAVVDAERAAELARVDLIETLQLDPTGVYEFQAPPDTLATAQSDQFDLGDLQMRAAAQRVDLRAEEARVDAAEQNVRVARSNRWPTVSLNGGYSSAYSSASPFSFSDQLDQRRGGSVSIGISVPLFDRGATSNATRRAEIQADNERLQLESLQQDVALQVRRSFLDFQTAKEQLVNAQAQLRAAELSLEASQDRYEAGAATLVELTQARAVQVQAASALVTARYNLQFQRILLDYYVGDLDPKKLAGT